MVQITRICAENVYDLTASCDRAERRQRALCSRRGLITQRDEGRPTLWARIHDCGGDLPSSCGSVRLSDSDLVLMCESAEDLLPVDPVIGEVDRLRRPGVSLSRCELAGGTVRPGGVVVQQVLGQHLSQVVLIDDQQQAGELAAQGAGDSLADRIRSGRLRRADQDPDAFRREHGVEGAGELACAIPDRELD